MKAPPVGWNPVRHRARLDLEAGDIISIRSPGGGGMGGQTRPQVAMPGEKWEPFG